MNHYEELIDQWIAEHKDAMIQELKDWVSIPSVSHAELYKENAPYGPDCRKMLDYALKRGHEEGFQTQDYQGYTGAIIYGDKPREIGFVCHLDVVPEGDHWIYAPYQPTVKDGFLIGRGSGDNKGSGVACLYLLKFFKENHIELNHSLRLMLGCAEETGMADFEYYLNQLHGPVPEFGFVADAAFPVCYAQKGGYDSTMVIPAEECIVDMKAGLVRNAIPDEATIILKDYSLDELKNTLSNVEITETEKGIAIKAHGKAGHAAFPQGEGNNAIVNLATALAPLKLKSMEWIAQHFKSPFGEGFEINFQDTESGKLTINVGVISKENGMLKMETDIRYPISIKADQITPLLNAHLDQIYGKMIASKIANPYYIDPKDEKVKVLMDIYARITGDTTTKPYAIGGGTYSRVVPNAMSFGPGLMKGHHPDFLPQGHGGAHGPDEALNIEDWLLGFKIYILSVLELDKIL